MNYDATLYKVWPYLDHTGNLVTYAVTSLCKNFSSE